eukprot:315886-Hanusia_phi.AAC.6
MGNALCCSQERRGLEELANAQKNEHGMTKSVGSDSLNDEFAVSRSRAIPGMKSQIDKQKWIRKRSGFRGEGIVGERDYFLQNQGSYAEARRGFTATHKTDAEGIYVGEGDNCEVVIRHTRQIQEDRRFFHQNYNMGRDAMRDLPGHAEPNVNSQSKDIQYHSLLESKSTRNTQNTAYDLRFNQSYDVSYDFYKSSTDLSNSYVSNAAESQDLSSGTYVDFSKDDGMDQKLSFDDSKLQSLPISS